MSTHSAAPGSKTTAPPDTRSPDDAHKEAAHLRRLIELQPSCLMRVDAGGRVLAANRVALGLLGAAAPVDVLRRSLLDQIAPVHHARWRDFVERMSAGTPASVECQIPDALGSDRTVLLQGVPLLDHEDGVPSFLLTAHDVSGIRRLERVLEERALELAARAEAGGAGQGDHAAALRDLRSELEEAHQLALLERERAARQQIDRLETALARSLEERQRLRARVQDLERAFAERQADTQALVHASRALETAAAAVRPEFEALCRSVADLLGRVRQLAGAGAGREESPSDDERA